MAILTSIPLSPASVVDSSEVASTEARFVRDSSIVIGHNLADPTIIRNGYYLEIPVTVTIGEATEIGIVVIDTLLGEDACYEGEIADGTDTISLSDTDILLHNPPPFEYEDILTIYDTLSFVGLNADYEYTDTLTATDFIDYSVEHREYDQLSAYDLINVHGDFLKDYSDTLAFYSQSGAGIHELIEDTITSHEYYAEGANAYPQDTLSSLDTYGRDQLSDQVDILNAFEFSDVNKDFIDNTDTISSTASFDLGVPFLFDDILTAGDSKEIIPEYGQIVDDTLSGSDTYDYSEDSERNYTDTLTGADSAKLGGEFERDLQDTLSVTDYAYEGVVLITEDTIDIKDNVDQYIDIVELLSATDLFIFDQEHSISDTLSSSDSSFIDPIIFVCEDTLSANDLYGKGQEYSTTDAVTTIDEYRQGVLLIVTESLDGSDYLLDVVFLDDLISGSDSSEVAFVYGYIDQLSATDSKLMGGDFTITYESSLSFTDYGVQGKFQDVTAQLSFTDYGKKQAEITNEDTLSIKDDISRDIVLEDSLSISESLYLDYSYSISDKLTASDSKTHGGEFIISYSDQLGVQDAAYRGIERDATDTLSIKDGFERLVSVTDAIGISDTFSTHTTLEYSYTDQVSTTDLFNFGGDFTKEYADSIGLRDIFRRTIEVTVIDTLLSESFYHEGVIFTGEDITEGIDNGGGSEVEECTDIVSGNDSYWSFVLSWVDTFNDNLEWAPSWVYEFQYIDGFEVSLGTVPYQQIYFDYFEWFQPYREFTWLDSYTDLFEVTSRVWESLFSSSFEEIPVRSSTNIFEDSFEYFQPYYQINITDPIFIDGFEYTYTFIPVLSFTDTLEPQAISWEVLYELTDPINAASWVITVPYDFEVTNPVQWAASVYSSSFEVVNSGVLTVPAFTDRFEISAVSVVWSSIYYDMFNWLTFTAWEWTYMDSLEPFPVFHANISSCIEKKNKRLKTISRGAYGNIVQYSWQETPPKINYLLASNVEADNNRVLTTKIHTVASPIRVFRNRIVAARGTFNLIVANNIKVYGDGRKKLRTHIGWTKFLYKYLNTSIQAGIQYHKVLRTTIYAPRKEKLTSGLRLNISVGKWKYNLWRSNIQAAGGSMTSARLHNSIYTHKLVLVKPIRTTIWAGRRITLAFQLRNSIKASHSATKEIVFTDILAPTKVKVTSLRTRVRSAWGLVKKLKSNIKTSYGAVDLRNVNIVAREGEKAVRFRTNLKLRKITVYHGPRHSILAAYGGKKKPFLSTYIGGPDGSRFTVNRVIKLRTNIKVVKEYFNQYKPINNRRKTNIVVGHDPNHPFITTVKLHTFISAYKAVKMKIRTSIVSDFSVATVVIYRSQIYALRCPLCMKSSISAAKQNWIQNNIWSTYGDGSSGYTKKYFINTISALRVPQGWYITNINALAKTKVTKAYRNNINVWIGPTRTIRQVIFKTSIPLRKMIALKLKTKISVARTATKPVATLNIWCQKGEFKFLRTWIYAPMGVKFSHYNTVISASLDSAKFLKTNIYVGYYDSHHKTNLSTSKVVSTYISAFKSAKIKAVPINIVTIGEILYIMPCGVSKIMPPMHTSIYASNVNRVPMYHTTIAAVAILSVSYVTDSILILTSVSDYFNFDSKKYEYVLNTNASDNFNYWVTNRVSINRKYNYDFMSAPIKTNLYYGRIFPEIVPKDIVTQYEIKFTETFELEESVIEMSSGVSEYFEDYLFSYYTITGDIHIIDVDLEDNLGWNDF